eukprot:gene2620-5124_t
MGSGISISPTSATEEVHAKLKRLVADKKKMDKVFKTIAASGKLATGKIDKNYDISHMELLDYFGTHKFDATKDSALEGFCVNNDVIHAAFYLIAGKNSDAGITKKQFRVLLPTLFLYSELWKVFGKLDVSIDDKKIFKGEYMVAYDAIKGISNVTFSNVTREEWESYFTLMDKDKNGYIAFDEFSSFVVKHFISAEEFIEKEPVEKDKEDISEACSRTQSTSSSTTSSLAEGEFYHVDVNGEIFDIGEAVSKAVSRTETVRQEQQEQQGNAIAILETASMDASSTTGPLTPSQKWNISGKNNPDSPGLLLSTSNLVPIVEDILTTSDSNNITTEPLTA